MNFKILFLGDIVGKIGRQGVSKILPKLKKKYSLNLIAANVENLAHGQGATLKTLLEIQKAGVDFFTSGNHIWKKKEIIEIFQRDNLPLIRPANYPSQVPGKGYQIIKIKGKKIAILNLMGRVFMKESLDCPFRCSDEILKILKLKNGSKKEKKYLQKKSEKIDAILVDFHAEASSEKVALGWYLDGRVSAVIGTHTHLPTADEKILPLGTAYVSDAGMIGAKESVIGIEKDIIIKKFLNQMPFTHEIPRKGICAFNSVLIEIDTRIGKAIKIERVDREIEI